MDLVFVVVLDLFDICKFLSLFVFYIKGLFWMLMFLYVFYNVLFFY